MSYSDISKMPVRIRKWFVERLIKDFQKMNGEEESNKSIAENIKKIDMFSEFMQKKNSI